MVSNGCQCESCHNLRLECGSMWPLYSRKLLIKGWAGSTSRAESAYIRAHGGAVRPPETILSPK